MSAAASLPPPSPALLALEGRAWFEFAALLPALPALASAPSGDGHPVLVLPGFMTTDRSTRALRWFLRDRGYHVHGWRLGWNRGPTAEIIVGLVARLDGLHRQHGRRVSLVGWSLGGIYARELARAHPEKVRCVITLASPFRDPLATNVNRLASLAFAPPSPVVPTERLRAPLAVPSTSFYSETDGIVAWQSCLSDTSPRAENLAVRSSHCGMGHHPTVLLAIADRLSQPEGAWQPFVESGTAWWPFTPTITQHA